MTTKQVTYWGNEDQEFGVWQRMTQGVNALSRLEGHAVPRGGVLIEPHIGPLRQKQERLRLLDGEGPLMVLTASITATIAAQRAWTANAIKLIGYDPLLVQAGGSTLTIAGADEADRVFLQEIWPTLTFISIEDSIGHIFSREILPIINEAVDFLTRGLTPEAIDDAMKRGVNYPKGPFAYAELFGWDNVYWGLRALEDMYGPRFRPHPTIRKMVGSSQLEGEDS